jgi:hypothetical protein
VNSRRRKTIEFAKYFVTEDITKEESTSFKASALGVTIRWLYLYVVKLFQILLCLSIISIPVAAIFLFSVHRVKSIPEASEVLSVFKLPQYNSRCKYFNLTQFKCLPTVLFIGASKCGTTSMTDYLSNYSNAQFVNRHVFPADEHREVHRFDRSTYGWSLKEVDLAEEWASSPALDDVNTPLIHYTPHYLYAPTVPFEVSHFYPPEVRDSLRFIVMLREPVARAVSSYWFRTSHLFSLSGVDEGSSIQSVCNHAVVLNV